MKVTSKILLIYALCLFTAVTSLAQSGVGARLDGTVFDPNGAIVPGAQIVLKDLDTGTQQKTVTNGTGTYFIFDIHPSRYSLIVSANGFKTYIVPEFVLHINELRTVDAKLVIGANTAQVEVNASEVGLNTSDATIGTVIEHETVNELPLNGRNFSQLVLLTPGAAPITLGQQTSFVITGGTSYPINGMRHQMNNFTLDGVENNQRFTNSYANSPPPDAIDEFKVSSHQTDSDVSFAGGSNINVVTRAGTNSFHGSLWEYVRNDMFSAQNYFDNYFGNPKLPFKQNQYGFFLGAPVFIPRVIDGRKSHTYIAGYFEEFSFRRSSSTTAEVPSSAERSGDFSELLGPSVGTDCLGREIRQGQIYDPSTTVANSACPEGYVRDPFPGNIIPSDRFQDAANIYTQYFFPSPNQTTVPNLVLAQSTKQDADQWGVRVDKYLSETKKIYGRVSRYYNQLFSPGQLPAIPTGSVNSGTNLVAHYSQVLSPSFLLDFAFGYNRTGIPYLSKLPGSDFGQAIGAELSLPTPSGGLPVSQAFGGSQYTTMSWYADQLANPDYTYQYDTDVKKIIGRHSMGFGFRFMRYRHIAGSQGSAGMSYVPESTGLPGNPNTGESLAAFYLGLPNSSNYGMKAPFDDYGDIYTPYWGDTWKVTPRLTLNYGVQYVYATPPVVVHNTISMFDIPTALTNPTATDWTFAFFWCSTNPVTGAPPNCPRRSIINPDKNNFAPRIGIAFGMDPHTVLRLGGGVFYDYNTNIEQNSVRLSQGVWPYSTAGFVTDQNVYIPGPANPPLSFDNPFPTSPQGPPIPQFTLNRFNRDPYVLEWNVGLERLLPAGVKLSADYVGSGGRKLPLAYEWNTAPAGLGPVQDRRPLPNAGSIYPRTNDESSNYNSLQIKATKSTSNGLTFTNSYTWSKSLDISSDANAGIGPPGYPQDLRLSYGPSDFDFKHVNTTSFVYQLPIGKGAKIGSQLSSIADCIVGGWQTSGIVSLHSGAPFSVTTGQDIANTGATLGEQTPNQVSSPVPQGFKQSRTGWFDTSAFVLPNFGTLGNVSRNSLRAPGYENVDFAVMKHFRITEPLSLQFRGEFFNVFNHTNFGTPDGYMPDSTFGQIWSAAGARDIQLALKLLW